jgi:hypothetical protein
MPEEQVTLSEEARVDVLKYSASAKPILPRVV